jgi:signal transduction histidine kinase
MKDKVRVLIVGGDEADRTAVQGALAANEIAAETTAAHELASAHDLERAAERLTGASLRIHAALSVAETLDLTAAEARELLAAHAAVTRLEAAGSERLESVSLSPKFASIEAVRAAGTPWLDVALTAHDGTPLGTLSVADPAEGSFRRGDEAVLRQLAQAAAIALEKARLVKAAQHAARMRDEVLAIVSHDLRSPLNTIAMSAGLLRESVGKVELGLVERIERGVKRMNRMISDLLDASCIDEGKLAVVARPEKASTIVREAVDNAEPIAGAKGCKVVCGAIDEGTLVLADRQRMLQVLSNVIGNAIRFSPASGNIVVDVQRSGPLAWFSVSDEGPGIEAEHLGRLFDRYYKADLESREGAGLGLFIARGIVEAHGGGIRVESERGRGTKVSFSIPLSVPKGP